MNAQTAASIWWLVMFLACAACAFLAFLESLVALARAGRERERAARGERFSAGRVLIAVFGGISAVALPMLLCFVVPKFGVIFKECEVRLPWVTELVITVANAFVVYWYALPPLLVVCLTAVYLLPALVPRRWPLALTAFVSLAQVGCLVTTVAALFLPLVQLISSLGGGN